MRVRRHICAIGVCAVSLLLAAAAAEAAFPGRNGLIAFRGSFGCGFEDAAIGTIDAEGSGMTMVTGCQFAASGPDWSPDGSSFLYSTFHGNGRHRISVATATGSEVQDLTAGESASFAPDGERFVYRSGEDRREIWRARVDGGSPRLLRARAFGSDPLWSPRNRGIAYNRTTGRHRGTWLISARTGRPLRRLTGPRMWPLDWSPDGRRLLCVGLINRPDQPFDDLYVVRADGRGAPRRITRTPGKFEFDGAWSPDGRRIVALDRSPAGAYSHRVAMRTMRPDGSRRRRILQTPVVEQDGTPENVTVPYSVSWQPLPR